MTIYRSPLSSGARHDCRPSVPTVQSPVVFKTRLVSVRLLVCGGLFSVLLVCTVSFQQQHTEVARRDVRPLGGAAPQPAALCYAYLLLPLYMPQPGCEACALWQAAPAGACLQQCALELSACAAHHIPYASPRVCCAGGRAGKRIAASPGPRAPPLALLSPDSN